MFLPALKIFERVKPLNLSWCGARGAAGPLCRRCFADARDFESRQAGPRRVARGARQTAIDDRRDAFDGDGTLGYVCRKNHLALWSGGDRPVLLFGRKIAM